MRYDNFSQIFSSICTCIIFVAFIFLPFIISEFLYRSYAIITCTVRRQSNLSRTQHKLRYQGISFRTHYGTFVNEFKYRKSLSVLMFYPIFLFNRIVFVVAQVLLHDYPIPQIIILNVSSLIVSPTYI